METNEENTAQPHCLQLYVKAGENGKSYGACPFCQTVYMIMDIKAREGHLIYHVTPINKSRPPGEFKKFANRLPVLMHGDVICSDTDEIMQYLDTHFPCPDLSYDNDEAQEACLNMFSKFSFYIKQVKSTPDNLLKELASINAFLEKSATLYLCGNTISILDCVVLPKLQHIRVAGKALKDFNIPSSMTAIWRYMGQAYASTSFRKTCPSDQEIVHHWSQKAETPHLTQEKRKQYSTDRKPEFSLDVPDIQ